MAKWDRRTRLTAILGLQNRTGPGLASASRGFQGYLSGVSKQASMAGQAVTGALTGHAGFAAAAMGASFVTFAGQAIVQFAEVEKKWAEVTTLMPQLTQSATDEILKDVRAMSVRMGVEIGDAIEASYQAASAGVRPDKLVPFLEVATKLSKAAVTSTATSVDILTSVINAYGLETEQAAVVSDQLMTAVRLGKFRVEEIAPTLGRVIPLAKQMGVEFGEITSAVAALTVQGSPAAEAMTQIRGALVALSKDGSIANQLFLSAAGTTFPKFIESGGNLQQALAMIVREANRTGQSVPQAFGRVEGAMAAMTLAGDEAAATFSEAMTGAAGATEEAFQKIEDTTAESIARLKARWSDLVTTIGNSIIRSLALIESMASGEGVGGYATFRPTGQFYQGRDLPDKTADWARAQGLLADTVLGQEGGLAKAWADATAERMSATVSAALGFDVQQAGRLRIGQVVRRDAGLPSTVFGSRGFEAPSAYELSAAYLGLPIDEGVGGGGGRTDTTLSDIAVSNREIVEALRSGQALVVRLDAHVDEGIILRADTVQRASTQIAARLGNVMSERTRSG